jgi:hypothetical protein
MYICSYIYANIHIIVIKLNTIFLKSVYFFNLHQCNGWIRDQKTRKTLATLKKELSELLMVSARAVPNMGGWK